MSDLIEKMNRAFWFPPEDRTKHDMEDAARVLLEDMRDWFTKNQTTPAAQVLRNKLNAYAKDRGIE